MVLGKLFQLSVLPQVRPAVSHVSQVKFPTLEDGHGEGGAHALFVARLGRLPGDGLVGSPDGILDGLRNVDVLQPRAKPARKVSMAMVLATSPAWCPPMPSATMKSEPSA